MDGRYNGWRNYETWAAGLWLGNDEGTDSYWRETAREAYREAGATRFLTRREAARAALADRLREEVEETAPELGGLYADLLNAALGEIDWYELAGSYLDDVESESEGGPFE